MYSFRNIIKRYWLNFNGPLADLEESSLNHGVHGNRFNDVRGYVGVVWPCFTLLVGTGRWRAGSIEFNISLCCLARGPTAYNACCAPRRAIQSRPWISVLRSDEMGHTFQVTWSQAKAYSCKWSARLWPDVWRLNPVHHLNNYSGTSLAPTLTSLAQGRCVWRESGFRLM